MTTDTTDLRELDARVAERVMGWRDCDPLLKSGPWEFHDEPPRIRVGMGIAPDGQRREIPHYSSDPAAMMLVIGRMQELGFEVDMFGFGRAGQYPGSPRWLVSINGEQGEAEDDCLPLTICRAALSAISSTKGAL